MAYNRDLKLAPNTEVTVELLFDTPREFESKFNAGQTRYAFSVKVLEDATGQYAPGEEVTYFTSYEPEANQLKAFSRGDHILLRSIQNVGDKFPSTQVLPAGSPLDPEPAPWEGEALGKESGRKKVASSTGLYPDQNPEYLELMERSMVAAAMIRESLIEAGVPEEMLGEYFLTKTGLTFWMQVK